jgi:hypothetical protein
LIFKELVASKPLFAASCCYQHRSGIISCF